MRFMMLMAAAMLAFGAGDAVAGNGKGCPPGLAKKSPPCVPPGLAKKQYHDDRYREEAYRYRRGDRIHGDYILIPDPYRYGLNRGDTYVRVGNYVYRIDRDTREVLDLIGAVSAILY